MCNENSSIHIVMFALSFSKSVFSNFDNANAPPASPMMLFYHFPNGRKKNGKREENDNK